MKTTAAVSRFRRRLRLVSAATVLHTALWFGYSSLPVAAAGKDARPDGQAKTESKRPGVRILILKGTYADYPSTSDLDPMSLFLGGLEKPGSFFDLCEKIDELARDDEMQHVLFDLSSPTLHLNLAQLSELSRHIHKLRDAHKRTFAWLETPTRFTTRLPRRATRSS